MEWKNKGVRFVKNGRTKQELPQYFNLYEDFEKNKSKYNLESLCKKYLKPISHFHGLEDTSVLPENAVQLASWSKGNLNMMKETNHVFGSRHPWLESKMPDSLEELCFYTHQFISEIKT